VGDDHAHGVRRNTGFRQSERNGATQAIAIRANIKEAQGLGCAADAQKLPQNGGLSGACILNRFKHDSSGALAEDRATAFLIKRPQGFRGHQAKAMIVEHGFWLARCIVGNRHRAIRFAGTALSKFVKENLED
jgi:hypothetical protein